MRSILLFIIYRLRGLPISVRARIGYAIGWIAGIFPSRDKTIATLQIRRFLPPTTPAPSTSSILANLGQSIMELLDLSPLLKDGTSYVDGPSAEEISRVFSDESPVIILTGHTANWDLLAAYGVKYGLSITTIGRKARNPIVQEVLASSRAKYGVVTIWRDNGREVRQIINTIKDHKPLAILVDQDVDLRSELSTFFGAPASTPVGLIDLGIRNGCKFVTAFIVRTSFQRYKIYLESITNTSSPSSVLVDYHSRLEKIICSYPEQWPWIHKRWRTLPNGERLSGKAYIAYLKAELKDLDKSCQLKSV